MQGDFAINNISGTVRGSAIQGRNFFGDISINHVFDSPERNNNSDASDLSVAVPEGMLEHQIRGRGELLVELTTVVDTVGGRVVLYGAGGSGKSTVAWAVARAASTRRTVWWVDATSRDSLVAGLLEVAVQAGAPRAEAREVWRNGESAKDLLWQTLHSPATQPWLLVVDNADEPDLLAGWIREPTGGNTVLVTSRDQRTGTWGRSALVRTMLPISDTDGAAILTELAPEAGSDDEAQCLAGRLGGLPLALMLVGRYLARTSTDPVLPESRTPRSFGEYKAALDAAFPDAISSLPHSYDGQRLSHTWELSLDLLESQGITAARPLLRLIAFFRPNPLPITVVKTSIMKRAVALFPDLDTARLEAAVHGLIGFGLLRRNRTSADHRSAEAFVLHPLIGEITRNQPDAIEHAALYQTLRITLLCNSAAELDSDDPATWTSWRLLLPHCTFTDADTMHAHGDEVLLHSNLAYRAAKFAWSAGLWAAAEEHYNSSLGFRARLVHSTHPDIIATRHNLASLKRDQGRFLDAEAEFRDIARIANETLGPDHPNTLATRHELARVLRDQGKHEATEREFSKLVPHMTRVLGPEHPHTLAARHELARSLRDRGQLDAARSVFEKLSAITTRVLGADSPLTLATRHELADVLLRQGESAAAQTEFGIILAVEIRTLGPEHPSTLVTRSGLARALMGQAEFDAAETEIRDILAAWSRAGAGDHPHALSTRGDLGNLLMIRGDNVDAETEYRHVLSAMVRAVGSDHPETFTARTNVALILERRGKNADAETELRHLLTTMVRHLGTEHSDTISTHHQLADLLTRSGRYAPAEVELRQIVAVETRVLGADHADTLTTQSEAAAIRLIQGNAAAALAEFSGLVTRMDQVLGADDERTLAARINLAYACQLVGEVAAAMSELRHVLLVCQRTAGVDQSLVNTAQSMMRQLAQGN
ncbi:FxSxx-COOH system tetratricopeptide repeat protein [Saccharopolyspora sp. NPDC050389]|uniref:FxSxx-COOH system tetratricopeptide repeat protein n=1 Tax=Saccharopolyspora sp. NPDC050389 TaxID=3155516 RepID=UPI003403704B